MWLFLYLSLLVMSCLLDACDHTRKMGCSNKEECWRCCSFSNCETLDSWWSSLAAWRPGPSARKHSCEDLKAGKRQLWTPHLTALCLTLPRQLPPTYIPVLFIKGKCLNFFPLPKRHPVSSVTINILAVFTPFLSSPCPSFPGYHSFHSVNCSFFVLYRNFSCSGGTFSSA